jgi:GAF domain-containing protein
VKPPRDELVAEVIVALTDTLREDFDVADMLYTLTTACVELLDVDEAGMLLVDDEGGLIPVAATHDGSDHLERLQILVREGPCLEAVKADEPVYSLDLDGDEDAERWPEFTRQARSEGFRAAHAEAVALRGEVVGGLNLFRREPGPVPVADRRIAHFLATAAAVGILHRRAQRNAETVTEQLEHALTSRIVVEQAKGFLAERHTLDVGAAFTRLRSHARSKRQSLTSVARAVVDGTLDIS